MAQRILKCFRFEERIRDELTFSDATKIRLNSDDPKNPKLQLKSTGFNRATGAPTYPLDAGLTVTTRVHNPNTLQQLLGFDAFPRDVDQPVGTTVQYKINDGTDDRFFNGSIWAIAGVTDWNSALVVTQNIATFPLNGTTPQKFGLVINLVTTDEEKTPTLEFVDTLMLNEIDYFRSIISDALIASLEADIRPVIDFVVVAPGGTRVNLRDLETAFNVVAVNAVYNETTDPLLTTNLFLSFDAVSEVVTLTSAVPRGSNLWIRFAVSPEVYLNFPSQDYLEVSKLPAIVIDTVEMSGSEIFAAQVVKNADTNTASLRRFPFRLQMEFTIRLIAEKNRTLLSMMDQALKHSSTNPLLPWPAVDEKISMRTLGEGLLQNRPNLSDKHETGYSLLLNDVHLFLRPEEIVNLVQQFNLTLNTPDLQGGPKYTDTRTSPC